MREFLSRLCTGVLALSAATAALAAVEPLPPLQMDPKQAAISSNVTKLIEELHYSQPHLDNSLSSAILDRYLDTLDGNRMYFTSSDIASFNRLRYELDDRTRSGELQPVFDIFNLFRKRAAERVEYAIKLLQTEPDYTVEESFRWDRAQLPWPATAMDLDEVWRENVKSDALRLMLTGKTWPEAATILKERYERSYKRVTQLTTDDVFETYMNAVAHNMDPHSSYLSPRQSEEYRIQMSLSYDGIGASLQLEDDYVKVMNIIPGGPAKSDGQLKEGDRITAVGEGKSGDLVDVIGWRLDDVVQKIRGPGGTKVRLQVLPAGAAPGSPEKTIELTRDKIKLEEQASKKSVVEMPFNGDTYKIGVITVPSFYQDFAARSRGDDDYTSTSRDVTRLIGEFKAEGGVDGIVMDLRANGGGHLSEATELSGLFIDRGPIVQLRETRGNIQVLDDPSAGAIYTGPLAILVDRYSASASEIFAAAIQDYDRGVIIGQQTFGKGSVQNLFPLDRLMRGSDNGQLTLTIGKYYRVTGESTQHRGVIPDIELPSMVDTATVGESTRDTALPWDRIQPTRFRPIPGLDAELDTLRKDQAARAAQDPDYRYLVSDVAAFKELNAQKTVSLNFKTRQAENKALEQGRLDRENKRRAALGIAPLAGVDQLESAEAAETILLHEAARVVAEMAELQHPHQRQLLSGPEARPAETTKAH
ncbi:MAG TPA: carboxy terminal-processing peptidase [Gammaproteobacteria bacterium]|nr:carboxy terminal-processing peptidase [Gammaproteobacteria bacterium]